MADLQDRILAEHRHAETMEALRRINTGLELLHDQGERQIRALASAEQKLESGLKYFVRAWQVVRTPGAGA